MEDSNTISENDLAWHLNNFVCICSGGKVIACADLSGDPIEDWFRMCKDYANSSKILFDKMEYAETCHAAMFLFRHSVELLLKAILINMCNIKQDEVFNNNHNLKNLQELITCETDIENYLPMGVILGLYKRDCSSFEYRYPVNKKTKIATCSGQACIYKKLIIKQCDKIIQFAAILEKELIQSHEN